MENDLKTVIDKALAHRIVTEVIEEQTGNLTQVRVKNDITEAMRSALTAFARQSVELSLRCAVRKPDLSPAGLQSLVEQVEESMIAAGLDALIKTTYKKHRGARLVARTIAAEKRIPSFYYFKIATHAGKVAWMIRYGFDPALLELSDEEADVEIRKLADFARSAGKPTAGFVIGRAPRRSDT